MSIANVYGNYNILTELKTGNAKVAFFGDSITNNGGTGTFTTFWHAALFEWHPDSWKGAWFHPEGSITGMFNNLNDDRFNGTEIKRQPGGTNATLNSMDRQGLYLRGGILGGTHNVALQLQFFTASLSDVQAVRANRELLGRWPDGAKIFEKADGSRDIATTTNPVTMQARVLAGSSATHITTGSSWQLRNPGSTANTSTVNYNPTLNTDLTVYGKEMNAAVDPINYTGSEGGNWNLIYRNNAAQDGSQWAYDGAFFGGFLDGMTISYYGDGGWTTGSHYAPGDSLNLNGVTDNWHYDAEYLRERAAFEGTTHAYVHIGQNDIAGSLQRSGAEALASLDTMLAKIRTEVPGVKIVITTIYTTVDDNAPNAADKAVFNAGIIDRANSASDLCCVDLAQHVTDTFSGDLDQFTIDWLYGDPAVTDPQDPLSDHIHPNQAGASAMQSYVWSRVVAAEAAEPWTPSNEIRVPVPARRDCTFTYDAGLTGRIAKFESQIALLDTGLQAVFADRCDIPIVSNVANVTTQEQYSKLLGMLAKHKA